MAYLSPVVKTIKHEQSLGNVTNFSAAVAQVKAVLVNVIALYVALGCSEMEEQPNQKALTQVIALRLNGGGPTVLKITITFIIAFPLYLCLVLLLLQDAPGLKTEEPIGLQITILI